MYTFFKFRHLTFSILAFVCLGAIAVAFKLFICVSHSLTIAPPMGQNLNCCNPEYSVICRVWKSGCYVKSKIKKCIKVRKS